MGKYSHSWTIRKVWHVTPLSEREDVSIYDILETHLRATNDTPKWYVDLLKRTGIRITQEGENENKSRRNCKQKSSPKT